MVPPSTELSLFILASTLVTGGAEKIVRALALGLPRHGISPRIICLHGPGELGEELIGEGVSVISLGDRKIYGGSPFFRLRKIFRGSRDSVLFCLDHHNAIFWGALSSRAAGLEKRVLGVHSTGLWKRGGSFTFSDRLVIGSFDRIVALAGTHVDYLTRVESIDPGKIALIHNGIDTGLFRPAKSPIEKKRIRDELSIPVDDFVVTIVAALRPEKNHAMFLKAASRVAGERGSCTFLIAGGGKEAGKLHEMSTEMGLGRTVRFMGPRNDISRILAGSDVSVLCSHPVVETFPLSVLEAMSSGLPVVATSVGSIHEMLDDGIEGILIGPDDDEALASVLLDLAGDPPKRGRIGVKARERVVRDFSQERMVGEYAALFSSLVTGTKESH